MSKIKNGGLDQYGAKPFEQQQFGTAGVEGVKDFILHSRLAFVVSFFEENYDDDFSVTRNVINTIRQTLYFSK